MQAALFDLKVKYVTIKDGDACKDEVARAIGASRDGASVLRYLLGLQDC